MCPKGNSISKHPGGEEEKVVYSETPDPSKEDPSPPQALIRYLNQPWT